MLDKKTEAMLAVASALTADDLDCFRGVAAVAAVRPPDEEIESAAPVVPDVTDRKCPDDHTEAKNDSPAPQAPQCVHAAGRRRAVSTSASITAGEYERQRTRESKVSTGCLGRQSEGHS